MTHSREIFGGDMTQEEIELMIRAMEEHLEVAETAKSPDLMQAIEEALAALEEMAAQVSPDDY